MKISATNSNSYSQQSFGIKPGNPMIANLLKRAAVKTLGKGKCMENARLEYVVKKHPNFRLTGFESRKGVYCFQMIPKSCNPSCAQTLFNASTDIKPGDFVKKLAKALRNFQAKN